MKQLRTVFIEDEFKQLDNPITNPIDLRIAKDNPYIMKELLGPKLTMGKSGNQLPSLRDSRRLE